MPLSCYANCLILLCSFTGMMKTEQNIDNGPTFGNIGRGRERTSNPPTWNRKSPLPLIHAELTGPHFSREFLVNATQHCPMLVPSGGAHTTHKNSFRFNRVKNMKAQKGTIAAHQVELRGRHFGSYRLRCANPCQYASADTNCATSKP